MRYGSLFSGAGGLDLAVEEVFEAECAWQCEYDAAASKVLAAHWPDVPNLRDVTTVDWSTVEPVDIMCGGYPCQPFSAAGQRKGTDDERHLWPYFAEAIRRVRPRYVVLENVAGHRSMGFDSVLGDLATLGYDAQWCSIRASDVGAPHRRERLFVLATDTRHAARDGQRARAESGQGSPDASDTARIGWRTRRTESAGITGRSHAAVGSDADVELLPTPRAADHKGSMVAPAGAQHVADGYGTLPEVLGVHLLPTPCASRSGNNQSASACAAVRPSLDSITDLLPTPGASDGNGGRTPKVSGGQRPSGAKRSVPLTDIPILLPTPMARDHKGASRSDMNRHSPAMSAISDLLPSSTRWGRYEPAIRRWEAITRPAPSPTEPNSKGKPRLAPAFSEWMMGWQAGWVTAVEGLSRNDQLRIIGNGVVTLQAVAALRWLRAVSELAA